MSLVVWFGVWFGSPLVFGLLFTGCLLPRQEPAKSFYVLRFLVAIGVGFGFFSCLSFFLLLGLAFGREQLLIAESLALMIVFVFFLRNSSPSKKSIPTGRERFEPVSAAGVQKAACLCFLAILAVSVAIFVAHVWRSPHGGFDAFAIWNLRAKFLFGAPSHWTDALSSGLGWSHLDYPLFIPTVVARGWSLAGGDTIAIPILLASLFTFGTVGLVVSGLSTLRGASQGFLAGSVLLATPFFLALGADQVADVPIGFFILMSFVLLTLRHRFAGYRYRLTFLAGLAAGFSAWTKNEGLLFLASTLISLFIIGFMSAEKRISAKTIGCFILGALPVCLLILFFKTQFAPANYIFSANTAPAMATRIGDITRQLAILGAFQREIRNFGGWPLSMTGILIFYLLVLGLSKQVKFKEEVLLLVLTLSLMLIGYYFVYIIAPDDLTRYSLNRILTQLWPSTVFAYFMLVRTIEEALTIKETVPAKQFMAISAAPEIIP